MAYHRIDLVRDGDRRRTWSTPFKEQVVLETLALGASVSVIARRHDIDTSLVYRWRRQFRVEKVEEAGGGEPFFPVAIGRVRQAGVNSKSAISAVVMRRRVEA